MATGIDHQKAVGFREERAENRFPSRAGDEHGDPAFSICRRKGYR
jgi:hypothetical protein